jgi:DNA-damage-inducible protein J
MSSTNINIRVDSDLKANAQEVLGNLGMDLSTAISVFLKQIVYQRAIPFAISEPKAPVDSEYTLRKTIVAFQAGDRGIGLEEFDKRMKAAISRGAAKGAR